MNFNSNQDHGGEEDKSIKYGGMIYNKEEIKVKPNQQEKKIDKNI